MHKSMSLRSTQRHITCVSMGIALLTACLTWPAKAEIKSSELATTAETLVFAGKCPNGGAYRLLSYHKGFDGLTRSYYDFEGPVGKGTVMSEAPPKVMAVRVCRPTAEIISANYWE